MKRLVSEYTLLSYMQICTIRRCEQFSFPYYLFSFGSVLKDMNNVSQKVFITIQLYLKINKNNIQKYLLVGQVLVRVIG